MLERLGHTVEFKREQTCCGQMHYNTGYWKEGAQLMRHFVDVYGDTETICIPSASCVAMIRDHYPKMARESGDARLSARVDAMLPRVFVFSELLADARRHRRGRVLSPQGDASHVLSFPAIAALAGPAGAPASRRARTDARRFPQNRECCGFGGRLRQERGCVVRHDGRQDSPVLDIGAEPAWRATTPVSCKSAGLSRQGRA